MSRLALLLILLQGCVTPAQSLEPRTQPQALPDSASALRLSYRADKTYTADDASDLMIAEGLINEVVQSRCFRSYFEDEETRTRLVQTNGKTRAQVVDHIASTARTFPVRMYYSSQKVLGYRRPPSSRIFTNSRYHRDRAFTVCAKASNILHESVHVMGYTHDSARTSRRPFSVPYTAGAAFDHCVSRISLCN